MVKITGSQRIDLLGVRKEDLPKVWADLGMPSGQAYTKGVRMVKTCVGTEFCRFGTQDSTERRHRDGAALRAPVHAAQGEDGDRRLPAQLRRGHREGHRPGRPGRRLAGGRRRRRRQVACARPICCITVETTEQALEAAELFFQYYRENGNYLERTYDFVERLGIDKVRKDTVYAPERRAAGAARSAAEVEGASHDAWQEGQSPVNRTQFIPLISRSSRSGRDAHERHRQMDARSRRATPSRRVRGAPRSSAAARSRIFNLGDRFLAMDNRCPHQSGPLCDGIVAGDAVVCPLHAWKVNLETGSGGAVPRTTTTASAPTPTRVEAGVISDRGLMTTRRTIGFLQAGHTPTLVSALLYFDVSFMAWVILGPARAVPAPAVRPDARRRRDCSSPCRCSAVRCSGRCWACSPIVSAAAAPASSA